MFTNPKLTRVPSDWLNDPLATPAQRLLRFAGELPETEAVAAEIAAVEEAAGQYVAAVEDLRAIDDAEASHNAKVRQEAEAAAAEGREPKPVKGQDWDGLRKAARIRSEVLLGQAQDARRRLDAQVAADVGAAGERDAAQLPELYTAAVDAIAAARSALSRLTTAHEVAVERLTAADPYTHSRPMPGSAVDGMGHLDAADKWLADREEQFIDPVIKGAMDPDYRTRKLMAGNPKYLEELNRIERAEDFTRTAFTRGYRHISEVGPSGLAYGAAETSEEQRTVKESVESAEIKAAARYF
ncbi:hypothetical protein MF406_10750 [Georgenia sp. TF02-10]|uniref:hypothetical protein n=1 Tax=Georgenia sp. TF02-10 TaxID=2917725 RepID=UPI001FA7B160|nr:hypothetical protein [Georgenia sp. TF02-10]UNX53476.1 hypothetical protein MF406_10750 [Georgenia sp. TF02-10]